ncbi:UspA domain protein (plasmid) [Natronomonas pharaonis DSM 2160]|uniref:UspA domain protein n=1 Tax=Natronomonas pharaonis (strain ATCC 35678 / DSM 2160 / CIP 103997 / JCM 8858 / NBRC 14720 / NCIMB 2260 / Gabara) TaxID=348780 RepID=Q3IM31_NATPD|nr:universal stress protein [Natronomonas pharaonis]CAI50834.1 UspA domain protein [Natronomonas pharaonis DSM 2160]
MTDLLQRTLVPVKNSDDAIATCTALADYLDGDTKLVAILHVAEQTEGYMDHASPEALRERANELFALCGKQLDESLPVRTELRFGTDVVEEIAEAAVELDVDAIVFRPCSERRLTDLLSGDAERRLLRNAPCPVVTLSDDGGVSEVSA